MPARSSGVMRMSGLLRGCNARPAGTAVFGAVRLVIASRQTLVLRALFFAGSVEVRGSTPLGSTIEKPFKFIGLYRF